MWLCGLELVWLIIMLRASVGAKNVLMKKPFQLPGFDWSQKDSTTWSDQKTYTVSQDVPGGEKVLYQHLKKLPKRYTAGEKVKAKA